ncbi:MAG TPA: VOC family protein [Hanamia sp.]|nr:VOC family protein [Hanamia sp.]
MKKPILITLTLATTFCLGFAFKSITTTTNSNNEMKRVTGIGGVFFKSKDPKKITEWYESLDSTTKAQTQWTPFPETTKYFEPSQQDFMINYRVENLEKLVEELKVEGVTIVDKIETYDYGKFVHILDGEGNKVQLWEAFD